MFCLCLKITLYTKRRVNMNTSTFFENLKRYLAVLALLTVINLITSPNYLWVIWPALGMGIALLNDLLDLNNSKRVG
ncbi:2TM domain-containing protein [Pseudoalteromonas marina]|nr:MULTISPECIES: 2TM domain-containing protein [Pseudoalteromonas]MDA8938884.1 2TM domain-containing protein [Pseudoalteromonas marina]